MTAAPSGVHFAEYGIRFALLLAGAGIAWAAGYYTRSVTHREQYKRELSESLDRIERVMRVEDEQRLVELCRECRTPLARAHSGDLTCAPCDRIYSQFPASGCHRT